MKAWAEMTRALILVAVLSSPVFADKAKEAQAHVAAAKQHFDLQEYGAAEAELKEAYRLDPKPEFLYGIAQAQRRNGDCEHAITSYQNYLRTNPKAEQAKLANDNITSCQAELDEARRKREAAQQTVVQPKVEQPPPPPPQPPPKPTPSGVVWTHDWIGHVAVASGAIAVIGGLLVARSGQSKLDDVGAAKFYDDFVARSSDIDSAKSQRTNGLIVTGIGAALIATGIVVYRVRSPKEHVTVTLGPRGAQIGWAW